MTLKILFWGALISLFSFGLVESVIQSLPWYAILTCAIGVAGGGYGMIADIKRT